MHTARTRNLLGAAALTISDLMLVGATAAGKTSASGASALVILFTAPGLSVTELGRRIGLSQSAATRMVDALAAQGLVSRKGTSARSVQVHLTSEGRRAAERVLRARDDVLAGLVRTLDDTEQDALAELLGKLLASAYTRLPSAARLCRLCDRAGCVADDRICPVGQAARRTEVTGNG
ncbi:MarR family winged helix-turn-helix transcriptional regulator [Nocardia transvalensis]|uniref:MarR family winged helix-turn-helix transcriptional regulator n=1 Tax=Nocardia transvalensis TaxID=37333 RepID=UPI001895108F|nr:MarR family transcriptional regulator [Nocardia transvalensis]MBF6330369.1 MarR family transcriptional regulator [Nocardia transvalensis]